MLDCDAIVEQVCRLPAEFRRIQTKSIVQLAEEIDVSAHRHCINSSIVVKHLNAHPELIKDWLLYSADKRVSHGWYFKETGNDIVVGYFPDGREHRFSDRATACAEFVVHEIDSIIASKTG